MLDQTNMRHIEKIKNFKYMQKNKDSFDKCITLDSDILQGCVWRLSLSDVEKIEILNDNNYRYGSLNYIRSNGKTKNWREDYYKMLK